MAAKSHPADDILKQFEDQGDTPAAHPADAILQAFDARDTPPPANVNVPLPAPVPAPIDPAAAPRFSTPMPDALAAPIAAAKKAFGDQPIIPPTDDPRLTWLATKPGEEQSGGARLAAMIGRDALGVGDLVNRLGSAGVSGITAAAGNVARSLGMSDTNANRLVGDLNLEALRRGTDLNSPAMMSSSVAPNKLAALTSPSVSLPTATAAVRGSADIAARGVNALTGRASEANMNAALAEAAARNPSTSVGPEQPAPPGGAAPMAQSAGAAATTPADLEASAMAPREAAAAQATAENYRLAQQAPQGWDATEFVPGVRPTLAETMGDAGTALKQKQIANSDLSGAFVDQERRNNEARVEHVESLAGTPTIVHTMEQARSEQASSDLKTAFADKQAVDAQPVVDQINAVLAGRGGKVKPIADAMSEALAPLYDSQGKLEADPELLYGARQQINYLLSKTAQQEKPGLREATAELTHIKGALDQVIEQGAPGYQQYLQNFATASRPIDVANLLQDWVPKLKDANGNITLNRVNTMMKSLVDQRQARGVNAAKSIDDATMEGLWNLRSDLLRKSNVDLGKARGSDTKQNIDIGNSMGLTAAHVVASHVPGGNLLLEHTMGKVKGRELDMWRNRLLDGLTPPETPGTRH